MRQLTVRGFDDELSRRLRRLAKRDGISLNQAALKLLRKGAGLTDIAGGADTIGNSLDHLIGTWSAEEADELRETALALEEAGADLLLLECVVDDLAAEITEQAGIPVIGIGSGAACDGQILVLYDLLGLTDPAPKHARSFINSGRGVADAVRAYVEAVHSGSFP